MLLVGPAQGGQGPSQSNFEAGVEAFDSGDLQQARRKFEAAKAQGSESPALLYNLGVVYYRLGDYDRAETAFLKLLDTPHAPLASYNLGLVLQARGDSEGANRWFRRALDDSASQEIRALAQRQLDVPAENAPGNTGRESDPVTTAAFLTTAAGYDNNIAGAPSDTASNQAGLFGELLASGRAYFRERRDSAVRLDAVAYTRGYPGNSEFDNDYLGLGAAWLERLEAARVVTGVTLSRIWFGGDLLEQKARLDLAYEHPGCFWSDIWRFNCELEGFVSGIRGGSGFSAYDGERYGGELKLGKNIGFWRFNGAWRFEVDQRKDLQTADEFFSLSPTRNTFSLSAERQVTGQLTLGAEQSYRFSRYDNPHRLVNNGQSRIRTRIDDRFTTELFALYRLDRRWHLGMELGWVNNRSTLDRYRYNRAEALVSLDAIF